MARPALWLAVATLLASALFILHPRIDLDVARLFFRDGTGFPLAQLPFFISLRRLGQAVSRLMAVLPVAALLVPFLFAGARFVFPPRAALFLITSMLLGPGLVVNLLLKGYVGRARPNEIVDFGGSLDFSRAWEIVDHCAWNCSFVSAEAAASMQLVALAFVVPPHWRRPVAIGALLFCLVMSVNRMAFGGHFLSDVVVAWLLTLWVMFAVHAVIYRADGPFTDAAIAGTLERAGTWTKGMLGGIGGRVRRYVAIFR
ncbi:phosphatase PAP2 family protein [Methylobrevis pamukkalensis]|uniref:phosphatase PAP2 family protein n=1 Tax=Methylobrevis pamukkalensis TaxID=1439726 RepID=UPI000845C640|nr:phosphatase PAP2 family protein [Methylobrevis pamukkalensis]